MNIQEQHSIYENVLFIDDIERTSYWPAKELFYDLLAAPLSQALGKVVQPSLRMQLMRSGEIQDFKAFDTDNEKAFTAQYLHLSESARALYDRYLHDSHERKDELCLSYEASPALTGYLQQKNAAYIDFRLAPLRFLPDVLIAVKSNDARIQKGLAQYGVSLAEIAVCANELKASYRYKQRYTAFDPKPEARYYFVGQTPSDNSIIDAGRHLRIADRQSELQTYFANQAVTYLPHPAAPAEHVRQEVALLEQIASSVVLSNANSYDLLCEESDDLFVGISSGLLQEVRFFGKQSVSLLTPICPLGYSDQLPIEGVHAEDVYYLLDYDTFTDQNFLNFLLGKRAHFERRPLRQITENKLRRLHDVWYAYATHRLHQDEPLRRLHARIDQPAFYLRNALSHVVNSLSKHQFLRRLNPKIYQQPWQWPDADTVEIRADHQVLKNHVTAGRWYKTKNRNHFMIVWNHNSELNTVEYKADCNELHFIDTVNRAFVAYPFRAC